MPYKNKQDIIDNKKAYYRKNEQSIRNRMKRYYKDNRDNRLDYINKNKERIETNRKKRIYGISNEEYKQMIISQNNKCAICSEILSNGSSTHLDHDHNTGKVRQILCQRCNHGLGLFRDNVIILEKAVQYLNKWN